MTTADSSSHGVLAVDKPAGPTSHDVVAIARRGLRTRRIGHTGTLDPFATGLLLLCVGNATRIAEYLTAERKRYTAVVRFGVTTDTDDLTGTVLQETDASGITAADLERAAERQRGAILQLPPDYSAKKKEGRRAYQLAREGVPVELEPVPVTVHTLDIARFGDGSAELDVVCSSGTYIRSIARDLGAALGVGAHLEALRRTEVGSVTVAEALPIESLGDAETVARAMIPPADALRSMPRLELTPAELTDIRHGRTIRTGASDAAVAVLVAGGEMVGMASIAAGVARPRKVFA